MTTANQAEYQAWNGDSGRRWVTDPDRRDHVMETVADALLGAAQLAVRDAVLDIGCGCGATTLAAARTVGPDGSVLGIDLSEPMLEVAHQRVAAAGLANVTLMQADAQTHSSRRAATTLRSAGSGPCSSTTRSPRSPTS
jgi:tRNA G46 methylase TrmB